MTEQEEGYLKKFKKEVFLANGASIIAGVISIFVALERIEVKLEYLQAEVIKNQQEIKEFRPVFYKARDKQKRNVSFLSLNPEKAIKEDEFF